MINILVDNDFLKVSEYGFTLNVDYHGILGVERGGHVLFSVSTTRKMSVAFLFPMCSKATSVWVYSHGCASVWGVWVTFYIRR